MTGPWLKVVVAAKLQEARDIMALELTSPDGAPLPPFSPGAHIDIRLGTDLVRQYSLCNPPSDRSRYRIGVLREPESRGGSITVHERLDVGQMVEISEPRNHFPLVAESKRTLLLAGGIGITPILCMAEFLAAEGAEFTIHYCSRSEERAAFLNDILTGPIAAHAKAHFDDGPTEQRLDLDVLLGEPEPDCHIYVCGPAGFINAVLGKAVEAGWPEEQLHREFFAPPAVEAVGSSDRFTVIVSSTGQEVIVLPNESAAEALAAAGIEVETSCEQGVCGTCLVRVLDGIPDHRDVYLTDAEHAKNDQFTPCCSRAKTATLLLDL